MNVAIGRVHKAKVSNNLEANQTINKNSKAKANCSHVPVTRSRMKSSNKENNDNSHLLNKQKLNDNQAEYEKSINTIANLKQNDENEQKIHPLNQRSPELHSFDSHSIKSQSEKLIGLEDKPFAFREKEYIELNSNRFEYQSNKSITDHSLNEICLFINKKPELKADSADFCFPNEGALCAPSIPEIKKKSRRKIDPVTEKKQQNFECYKEFCKLKLIHNLITKELKSIKEDDERYEQKLNIINENKERHENDLGYYLGIEDSRRKRIRRLATEIERKHRCLVPKCSKAYGSEGSLNQHLIRKHPLVFEEWMKRITEKENESQPKKSIISREDKNQIRKEIEKMCAVLCKDEDSNYDNSDSD